MMAHSHVPKFGNWDADNIPYSAYFENASREKSGFTMNPNDPMENPEASKRVSENVNADEVEGKASHIDTHSHKSSSMEKGSNEVLRNHSRRHLHRRRSRGGSKGSFTAEFDSEKSKLDHPDPVMHIVAPQTDHKRSSSKRTSTMNRHKSASHSFNDHEKQNHKATATPKFGNWDVTDPKSGEGYTAMFSKIKEERQHMSSQISPPLNNSSNIKDETSSFRLSKYCCCLFTSESK